jgi:hypothetical protein
MLGLARTASVMLSLVDLNRMLSWEPQRLGHSSVETTKSHYADPRMDDLRRAVDGDRGIKIDRAKGE